MQVFQTRHYANYVGKQPFPRMRNQEIYLVRIFFCNIVAWRLKDKKCDKQFDSLFVLK